MKNSEKSKKYSKVSRTKAYTIVLTHDVDHLSLRSYPFFSKMTASFFKRCLWNNLVRTFRRDITCRNYLDSVKWCIIYPLIKLGIVDDPWEKAIYNIMSLEKKYGVYSTFFFIPFPNRAGHIQQGLPSESNRAATYDLKKYKNLIREIELEGWEVAVHGIDSHISVDNAREEIEIMKSLIPGKERIGIRMHWLYQSDELWENLKKAGFYYDATFGNNDLVGFLNNKKYPFKKNDLWIIPLNIMDSTLLGEWHDGLSIYNAWNRVEALLNTAKEKNAIITVLWHTNVFGVHRYWGSLYEKILQKARADHARILRCIDLCDDLEKTIIPLETDVSDFTHHQNNSWIQPAGN